jgi:hypothetical protein
VGSYTNNTLYGVAAGAANDVWAVGAVGSQTLILHWDGSGWTIVPGPGPSPSRNELHGVAVIAANDAWAIGHYDDNGEDKPLALHWNGSAWSIVATPQPQVDHTYLTGLAAVSGSDLWAVGYTRDFSNQTVPLTLHWNGSAWSLVPAPLTGNYPLLRAVAARAANDVWAVGVFRDPGVLRPIFEHWDVGAWSIVPGASAGGYDNDLYGVAALPGTNLWAAGAYVNAGGINQTLIDRYAPACNTPTVTAVPSATATPRPASPTPSPPLATRTPTPSASPTAACALTWRRVPSPNEASARSNWLRAVHARGPNDVWAVGSYNILHWQTLIMHWDGVQWTRVPCLNPGTDHDNLYAVDGVAADDVWAVGGYNNWGSPRDEMILHWDGTAWTWLPVFSPGVDVLYAVAAVAANDVWAVGSGIMHWDGTAWTVVPSPGVGLLNGLTVVAPDNIWATGYYTNAAGRDQTLVEHWDGHRWRIVPSPNSRPAGDRWAAVAGFGASDVWTVGTTVAHWDGTAWSLVANPGPGFGGLTSIAGAAPNDIWAAGEADFWHWDGGGWQPAPHTNGVAIALSARAADDVWAVGGGRYSFTERYSTGCGVTPTVLPSATSTASASPTPSATFSPTARPSASSTPGAPTRTPPPSTPAPTLTACAILFTDVNQNNPFYGFIRCLACRQIISGYADGTFRWANNITRGQLAKILAGTAGLTDPVPATQQSFADVPAGQPFWLWIERLAEARAISGYTCGGPGEPCDPANRPYFRPAAAATRGQIAKISATAAGLTDPVPSTQRTFADVPPGNPFWLWIEQLAGRGVISGYTCGGPGEPCDPANRPYFRWGVATTRGQLTKIAANTFLPACQSPAEQ